jgi:CubicO group peptidase (beta-lactamase class C family)
LEEFAVRIKTCLVGLALFVSLGQPALAQQSLNVALFERYLVLLREQLAIPGLSAAIVQGGRTVWTAGLGQADVAAALPARADTPYPLLGLSQVVSATVLLQECVDHGHLELTDPVRRWASSYPDETLTIAQLLSHQGASGDYQYNAARLAVVDEVIQQCANDAYPSLVAARLEQFAMVDSVPGADAVTPTADGYALFTAPQRDRYAANWRRLAVPYRVDDRGRATASAFTPAALGAGSGLVASAADLASFDLALRDGLLLTPDALRMAWTPVASTAGLGWFVQRVGADTVVWQYGLEAGAYSSLMLKVPGRDLTLVLLANSDAVSSALATPAPDVNASLFARLFFRIFLD